MKLYTVFTPSHDVMRRDWLLATLPPGLVVHEVELPQECPSATFRTAGWTKTTLRKVEVIIQAILDNPGECFVYSDVDVQFFGPIEQALTVACGERDIVFQRDNPRGTLCTGFFACVGNPSTRRLWEKVRARMQSTPHSDQAALNHEIALAPGAVRWARLPPAFFGGGTFAGEPGFRWKPGIELALPPGIALHHANWTTGVENKLAQLAYVRAKVTGKLSLPSSDVTPHATVAPLCGR